MVLYAESSAVLGWLLGEPTEAQVGEAFKRATTVVASVLTGIECARALIRGVQLGALSRSEARLLGTTLAELELGWQVFDLSPRVSDLSRAPFAVEPVRSLDAIHLATIRLATVTYGPITVASFDARIRANAVAMGLSTI